MSQFNQLHIKVQQFLMALQSTLPSNCHLTLDVNLTESWIHKYYIGINGFQYMLWHNCLDTTQDGITTQDGGTFGYELTGYRPF